jgi:hypothetical protein
MNLNTKDQEKLGPPNASASRLSAFCMNRLVAGKRMHTEGNWGKEAWDTHSPRCMCPHS